MRSSNVPIFRLLESCNDAKSLASLHSLLLRSGLAHHSLFATKLTCLYAKLCSLRSAQQVFDETPEKTTFLYNAALRAHVKTGQWKRTLLLFRRMLSYSMEKPDCYTFPIVIKACSELSNGRLGEGVHGLVKKSSARGSDMFVGAALIGLYATCGKMEDALCVFSEFSEPDVVLWTSIISGYLENGHPEDALWFFYRMVVAKEIAPDPVTLMSAVSACAQLRVSKQGRACHGCIIRRGFNSDLSLNNALLNFYAKVGCVHYAKNFFNNMVVKDVITWSCMITCYVHNVKPDEALLLYDEMVDKGFEPNSITVVSALQACGATCNLVRGRKIHELATQKGSDSNPAVCTALVDMYMKCSCFEEALHLFNEMPCKDVVLWGALISGYCQNGLANQSLDMFRHMLADDVSPDAVIIVKILVSCSQLGILRQALCLHGYLVVAGFEGKLYVGAALVDLYSKCGSLSSAIEVFEGMGEKDVVVWSSIIAAYGIHGCAKEAIEMLNKMIKSSHKPNHITFVSILSACSHAGLVEEGIRIFGCMLDHYGVAPNMEHYSIFVDLLCRQGELEKALELINQMPIPAGSHVWAALLSGCRIHHNLKVGEIAAKSLLRLDANHPGYYMLLSNLYANDGRWEMAADTRKKIQDRNLRKTPGLSSIEVDGVTAFWSGDRSHSQSGSILVLLKDLAMKMTEEGYVPEDIFMDHEMEDAI